MQLTRKQEEGLKIAIERYKNKEPWTCIAGYAGSGKSTLISFIISALNLSPDEVCYIAFTGKAVTVLKNKGCSNAMTAHKLLYKSERSKETGEIHQIPIPIDEEYRLIIVDEVSMLPDKMWQLLLTHKRHIIALGDPGQLPPIGEDNQILKSPHVFLDEVTRQAQDSGIIRLSMHIRDGKRLPFGAGEDVQILQKSKLSSGMCNWADQIICGSNRTRRNINSIVRTSQGIVTPHPIEGERIICLENLWESPNEDGDILVNGTVGTLNANISLGRLNKYVRLAIRADFLPDYYNDEDVQQSPHDLYFRNQAMDYKMFTEGKPTIDLEKHPLFPKRYLPTPFDYAYCITCHKAQGSEYGKVLVVAEQMNYNATTYKKWLYTACTRAKEKLVILQEGC